MFLFKSGLIKDFHPHLFIFNYQSEVWARGYKTFFMLNSAENEICSTYKKLNANNLYFFSCKAELSMKFFLLINIKMPTIVGILIFISRKNSMLNWVGYEKCFITSGSGKSWRRCLLFQACKPQLIYWSNGLVKYWAIQEHLCLLLPFVH